MIAPFLTLAADCGTVYHDVYHKMRRRPGESVFKVSAV